MNFQGGIDRKMGKILWLSLFLLLSALSVIAQKKEQIVVGTIQKVDAAEKRVQLKDLKGGIHTFKWGASSVAHGATEDVIWAGDAAVIGSTAAAIGAKAGEEYTLRSIHWFGAGTAQVKKGMIRWAEGPPHKIGVKNGDNAEEIFILDANAVIAGKSNVDIADKMIMQELESNKKGSAYIVDKGGVKTMIYINLN